MLMSRRFPVALTALALLVSVALPAAAAAAGLKVMSYNVNWGAPDGDRLDDVARVIASSGADVIGVQQLRRFARVAKKGDYGCKDQPAVLARLLKELTGKTWYWAFTANTSIRQSSRHCISVTTIPRQEGVAVFSRYPISSSASYRLSYERGLAKAKVQVPGAGTVTVYTVHLDSTYESRRVVQARQVASIVAGSSGPTFLTGDMNSSPGSTPIQTLARIVRDTWAEKGSGSGATRNGRIDYVFYRGSVRLESVQVIQEWASDHRPVLARFVLP